ncbi:MAG TPA: hypothetical protein VGQ57_19570, partial [Polyangiaceae bacterium]|nr:hypothetical protein [Polyangiaceae bacterium]
MALDTVAWVLLGAAALLVIWGFAGKKQPKPAAAAQSEPKRQARPEKPRPRAAAEEANPSAPQQSAGGKPGPKAIVWEVPSPLDDEDITILRTIPVFDNSADISIEPAKAAGPSKEQDEESEEERVSRLELSFEEGAEADEVTAASARILLYAGGDTDR